MNKSQHDSDVFAIDEIDRKIIVSLHRNGRISYTDLAREIGLSRVSVQSRINMLMEEGVIERFTAVINAEKIGIGVSAFFYVEVEPQQLLEVADLLKDDPFITSLYHMTGPSKLHVHGLFRDSREMEQFLGEKLYPLPGVTRVDCQVMLKSYKTPTGIRL
ncbi:Lrp/AsnC family transcriptional regulator [Gorillibacterium sp. CAU 1737]|uniref:Lrp/AsnC family transcriptional regulator n=1 Tax=Gorillibacterium sp. CAU 1737 TaxID=3140362 RepID=UPI003260B970